MKQIKLFTLLAALLLMLLPVSMMAQITVAVDNTSTFVPTQIVNGDFSTRPFMPFKYNGTWYNTWDAAAAAYTPTEAYWTEVNPNGIGEGWNTTETQLYDHGLFEWTDWMQGYNSTLYGNGNNNGHGTFLEMNACNSAVLYQDLPTNGHDVIRWSLDHAVRTNCGANIQAVRVEVGAPEYSGANIVAASGVNNDVNSHIQSSSRVIYRASGITNPSNATYGFNGSNLEKLSLSQTVYSDYASWHTVTGVYVIPSGQAVTRFGFIAEVESSAGCGNLLDNLTFSTLIGNLSAHLVEGDAVELKGYWGESDAAKKMKVVIGSTTHTVDMSSVRGHSFTIIIPAATIGSETSVTVYHEDYYSARLTIYIAPTYSVALASGTANASDWSFSPTSAKSGLTVAINYNGTRTIKDVTVGRNITSTIEFNNSNASTAINSFNNTPRSKLLFTSDYSHDLTVTRTEGEIDLNGHTTTGAIFTQNNQYGYSLTIKNGSLKGVDGAVGWSDWYSGTLIFDNVTMSESLWTDGHDVIIKSGTYSYVQNYKKGDTPGTVTIFGGKIGAFNTDPTGASNAGASNGTYTLYGGKYAFDPRNITAYTVIIPTGYAVQDNTDSDAGTYPYKVVNTDPSYAVEFENLHPTEVTHDHQWTFTMPPYDVMVAVEYAVASVTVGETTTNYSTFAAALSAWVDGSTLTLLADVMHNSTINISNTRTLDLNGYGLTRTGNDGGVFYLSGSANFILKDSDPTKEHKFTIANPKANGAGKATVNDALTSGYETFTGGYITGGYNNGGAGVLMSGGTFTMNGGTFIGNDADRGSGNRLGWGGAVEVKYGTFTMNGGAMIGNIARYGGGLSVHNDWWDNNSSNPNKGSATLNNGLIKYNFSSNHSGGIHTDGANYIHMTGGTIINNYTVGNHNSDVGGGLIISNGTPGAIAGRVIVRDNQSQNDGPNNNININVASAQTQAFDLTGGFNSDADVYVYAINWTPSSTDAKIAYNATMNDLKYIHSDNANGAGVIFFDGTHDWIYDSARDKFLLISPTNKHQYSPSLANTIWLSTNASTTNASIFTKPIIKYTSDDTPDGWYLIASPIGEVNPVNVTDMTSSEKYDIFQFNQNPTATGSQYLEWENWNQAGSHYHFNLLPGKGYLYANNTNVTLTFVGEPYSGSGEVTLVRDNSNGNPDSRMLGWNLIGNPFGVTATINKGFYRMNDNNTEVIAAQDNNIAPMEGIFVHADNDSETVTFNTGAKSETADIEDRIVINLSGNDGTIIDRAIVSFDEGRTLPKFQISENSTKLYIPKDGEDYAIAYSDRQGEIPLNFKVVEDGSYTLTFSAPLTSYLSSLTLIDNLTGVEVDMLAQSSYTFTSKTSDYASRFRLVFSANENEIENEDFAFISNDEIIINGIGTIQIIDMMGRVIVTKSTEESISTDGMTPGVYVLQLITGTETKTQKIIVNK